MKRLTFNRPRAQNSATATLLVLSTLASICQAGTITDPPTDAFAPGPDITAVSTSLLGPSQNTLQIGVNFAGPVLAPSTFNVNSLGGYIILDTNANANLSAALAFLTTSAPPAAGIDFYVDLFSEEFQPGNVSLLDSTLNVVGTLPITFGSTSFSIDLPVSLLGTSAPGIGVVVGTFNQASDLSVLNGAAPTPVPEPSSATLFLLLCGAARLAWRLRKLAPPDATRRD